MRQTRRRIVVLSLMGASAFALAACKDETVETSIHSNPQACVAAGGDAAQCEAEFKAAQATHAETAPRYDALAVCEEQHGAGKCEATAQNGGGGMGSVFMPLLMGYAIGNLMSSGSNAIASRVAPKPMYPVATGGYASADGAVKSSSLSAKGTMRPSAFAKPAATHNVAPLSRASVAARGGFGSARASSGG